MKTAQQKLGNAEIQKSDSPITQHAKNLEVVSKGGEMFLRSMTRQEIFRTLCNLFSQIVRGESVVSVQEYFPEDSNVAVRELIGPDKKIRALFRAAGMDPVGVRFPIPEDMRKKLMQGHLVKLEGGLHELSSGSISRVAAGAIEEMLGLHEIYAMAFIDERDAEKDLLGTVALLEGEKAVEDSREAIEVIVNQAGLALRRQKVEAQLQKADRDKNTFLATLAHELRNPLAPIEASTDYLQVIAHEHAGDYVAHPEWKEIAHSVEIISRQTGNMRRLLDDLLDIARIIRGKILLKKEPLCTQTLVERAAESTLLLIRSKKHKLIVEAEKDVWIYGDPVRIEQVVVNLLNNAAKYTPHGGTIELRAKREGSKAVISVKDNGIGIAKDMLENVFHTFTQAPLHDVERGYGGLGIGLTIVNNLVRLHGGDVKAESEGEGKGSTFTVRLPLVKKGNGTKETDSHDSPGRKKVMVVDDNADVGEALTRLLTKLGQEARYVPSAREALENVNVWHPNICLLDIGMPEMSGYELSQKIRNMPHGEEITLVAITGYGQEEDKSTALRSGFDMHLVKPVGARDLTRILSSHE